MQRVQRLSSAVSSIPGVCGVSVNKHDLSEVRADELSLLPYADLPLAALRRSNGGLPSEVLVAIAFQVEHNKTGWLALEFLSWWVRDAARGGSAMQLRSLALPPMKEQFGETLRFQVDWFYSDPEQNMERLLDAVNDLAHNLEEACRHYGIAKQISSRTGQRASADAQKSVGVFARVRGLFAGR